MEASFLPQRLLFQLLAVLRRFPEVCEYRVARELRQSVVFQPLFSILIWVHCNASASDFKSVVLIRMLPVALNSFSLPFVLLRTLCSTYSSAKLDSLKIVQQPSA